MPYDVSAIERGYGECVADWNGHEITLRYRADINNRALIAMKRLIIGVIGLDGVTRFPDVEALIDELIRVLLPSGPRIPKAERGWDLTRDDVPLEVTFDEVVDLAPGLPAAMLGAIFRDVNDPNRKRLAVFSSTSSAEENSASRPTSSISSETPNGQGSIPGPLADSITREIIPVGASGLGRSASSRSPRKTSSP